MERLKRCGYELHGWAWDNRLLLITIAVLLGVYGAGVATGLSWHNRH